MLTGRRLAWALVFAGGIAVSIGVSCRGFFVQPTLTSITVLPLSPTIQTGTTSNTVQMSATGVYNDGSSGSAPVQWSISPSGIATITTGGLVTSQAQGTATITATSTQLPSISGTQALTVTVGCIQSIAISPTSGALNQQTQVATFKAMATTCNGVIDITTSATWASSNTAIATVSAGVVTAVATLGADGTTIISASVGNITSNPSATVTVTGF